MSFEFRTVNENQPEYDDDGTATESTLRSGGGVSLASTISPAFNMLLVESMSEVRL